MQSKPVSLISEVDLIMSQVNVLLSEVAMKLSKCPVEANKLLPRVNNILSEMMWIVNLSKSATADNCFADFDHGGDVSLEWDDENNIINYSNEYYSLFHDDALDDQTPDDHEEVDLIPDDDLDSFAKSEDQVPELCINDKVIEDEDEDKDEEDGIYDDENIADRVMSRRRSRKMSLTFSPASDASSILFGQAAAVSASSAPSENVPTKSQANNFISSLLTFVSRIAPGDVFSATKSVRRKKKRMMKSVHPVLRCLFKHSLDLFTPAPGPVLNQRPPVPVVDWTRVNERSLGNLPKPQMFPKLGCSDDPNIYADRIHDHGAHGRINTGTIHAKEPYPFGVDYGFMTDLGVISVNKGDHMEDPYQHVIQGHVWSRELHRWVIHAKYVKDKDKNSKEVKKKAGAIVPKKPRRKELR